MAFEKGKIPIEVKRKLWEIHVNGFGDSVDGINWAIDREENCYLTSAKTHRRWKEDGSIYAFYEMYFFWKGVGFTFFMDKDEEYTDIPYSSKIEYRILKNFRIVDLPGVSHDEKRVILDRNLDRILEKLEDAFKTFGNDGDIRDKTLPENVTVIFVEEEKNEQK